MEEQPEEEVLLVMIYIFWIWEMEKIKLNGWLSLLLDQLQGEDTVIPSFFQNHTYLSLVVIQVKRQLMMFGVLVLRKHHFLGLN